MASKKEKGALALKAAALDAEVEAEATPPPDPDPAPGVDPDAPGVEPGPAPGFTPLEEARGAIDLAVEMLLPFYPALDQVYTEPARDRLARTAGPLLEKYGISITAWFKRWKEEIEFAFVATPMILRTVQIVQATNAARAEAKKQGGQGGAPAAPGGAPPGTPPAPDSPAPVVSGQG